MYTISMAPIMKSDIFFFITSISVTISTVIIIIAGYYIIRTLQNVRDISVMLKKNAERAEEEVHSFIHRITESPVFSFVFGKPKKKK
jgi:hypothetical protein